MVTLPGYVALLVGLLTVVGPRGRRRTVKWSWNLLWVAVGVLLITAGVSLPGLVVSFLIGRVTGLGVRYLSGVLSERAYGDSLVAGVRRAGFEPVRLLRVADETTGTAADEGPELDGDQAARALTRSTDHRLYELTTRDREELDLVVIDGDRQVVGMLTRLWRSLRMRGIEGRSVVSLRQAAERAALLAYAARAAGVRTPRLLSIAEADDSMLLVQERPDRAVPLGDLDPDELTDEVLQEIWAQLQLAHDAGIAHRSLTSDVLLVETVVGRPIVWLTSWEQGDVASSDLARRMDVTQLLALLALRVGATRALDSAADRPARRAPRRHRAAAADDHAAASHPRRDAREQEGARRAAVRAGRPPARGRRRAAAAGPVRRPHRADDRRADHRRSSSSSPASTSTRSRPRSSTGDWRWTVVAFALGLRHARRRRPRVRRVLPGQAAAVARDAGADRRDVRRARRSRRHRPGRAEPADAHPSRRVDDPRRPRPSPWSR